MKQRGLLLLLLVLVCGNAHASDPTGLISGLVFLTFVVSWTVMVLFTGVWAWFKGRYRDRALALKHSVLGSIGVHVGIGGFVLDVLAANGIDNAGFDQSMVKFSLGMLAVSIGTALLPLLLARLPRADG